MRSTSKNRRKKCFLLPSSIRCVVLLLSVF